MNNNLIIEKILQLKGVIQLNNDFKNSKLSNLYLINCIDSVVKEILIKYISKKIYCESKKILPCDKCNNCVRINNNNFIDISIYGNKKEDFKRLNIEKIIQDIITKPFEQKIKLIILNNFDKMIESNQNILLKIFEEIPNGCIIILFSQNNMKILKTIQSRCRMINIENFNNQTIREIYGDIDEKYLICGRNNIEIINDLKKDENFNKIYDFALNYFTYDILEKLKFFETNKQQILKVFNILEYVVNWQLKNNQINSNKCLELIIKIQKQYGKFDKNVNKSMIIDSVIME